MVVKNYDKHVFVNCPFDNEYVPMFDAILFTIYDCGFLPRCAREIDDSGQVRIEKITKLINDSMFGLHDISRTELDSNNLLPRFNMPLELGVFFGAMKFGNPTQKTKRTMIVDKEDYRYQKFISDIAGQDIRSHDNDPEKIITIIRNWLKSVSGDVNIPGAATIKTRYREFTSHLPELCKQLSYDPTELTYNDKSQVISIWLSTNPSAHQAA